MWLFDQDARCNSGASDIRIYTELNNFYFVASFMAYKDAFSIPMFKLPVFLLIYMDRRYDYHDK